ncbi:MAG: hypothetical protein IID45_08560 [Planctomycetes bacterium]|nr:hypothetical protein [Planctomycetota bacterium]
MPTTLTIRDETTSGKLTNELTLELLTERISVRELIRSRVYQEVKDYNVRQPEQFRGLVKPTDAEETLNGFRLKARRQIDWKPQFEQALHAFETNQIFILINDRQAETLAEEFDVRPDTSVTFLRMTMLVGG